MSPRDSSDIDQALIARLGSDAQLLALMPNGVYWDEAPPASTQFVIVSFIEQADAREFSARAFEDALYLVKAVELSTVATKNCKAAAARIDALLEEQPLTVANYEPMALYREARIRATEVDDIDPTIRWFHRGGHYRVVMST
jgi:hypothetical protein